MNKIWKFIKDEDGLELTEYAVIGALIVIAVVVAITALSTQITAAFNRLSQEIQDANAGG
jgi:pilus assembly protein Flp/PilA